MIDRRVTSVDELFGKTNQQTDPAKVYMRDGRVIGSRWGTYEYAHVSFR